MGLLVRKYQHRLLRGSSGEEMHVDPKSCQRTRLKKVWTDSEKNWTLFNIHTSDKL